MIKPELKLLIEENALALATVGQDNNPHCIAVGFVKVVSNSQILITNNYMKTTLENIKQNPTVCLAVWNKHWKEKCVGYQLKGTVEYFSTGKWAERVKQIPENKGMPNQGAILVTISNIKKLA